MTAKAAPDDTLAILETACAQVGRDVTGAELLHRSENAIYRLPGSIVARISQPGQYAAAVREVRVARWLETSGLSAVKVAPGVTGPVEVDGRSVTFWQELPPHRHGTPSQVATVLRQLHALTPPTDFPLGQIAPFVRLEERIQAATVLDDDDQRWMFVHLAELYKRWDELPEGLLWSVIHGDAWIGNVATTDDGRAILLDLERTSIGPPEWDLVHTAIKWSSFGWISTEQYGEFCTVYGHDVTKWAGFELLRDIREFRMTTMAVQSALGDQNRQQQARHRLACIRGDFGSRPWPGWAALA